MVFFAILFVLHNKSYYWLSQFVTAPSKGVAFHDILRFTFFCSFLLSHNGLYKLCLFLGYKITQFLANNLRLCKLFAVLWLFL